eukprot:gene7037-130_t
MGSTTKELMSRLLPSAADTLSRIMRDRRSKFWASEELQFRIRKYPKSGNMERVSIVKPHFSRVNLFSQVLKKMVPLELTPKVLREIESQGGLDSYLLQTPDALLRSDVASKLKWRITSELQRINDVASKLKWRISSELQQMKSESLTLPVQEPEKALARDVPQGLRPMPPSAAGNYLNSRSAANSNLTFFQSKWLSDEMKICPTCFTKDCAADPCAQHGKNLPLPTDLAKACSKYFESKYLSD